MCVVKDNKEVVVKVLKVGLDMDLGGNVFGKNLKKVYEEGLIIMVDLDRVVGNVFCLKFQMGLFENLYVLFELVKKLVYFKEYKELVW